MDVNRLPQIAEAIGKAIPGLAKSADALVKLKHASEAGTVAHLDPNECKALLEMLRMFADAAKRGKS